ncbi:MAG TPA: glycoside hydrolase family 18 protein [Bacteroidota bacterium]|nr:glycoside hydrolase family 18 protein [Bacteroidota bacterium]
MNREQTHRIATAAILFLFTCMTVFAQQNTTGASARSVHDEHARLRVGALTSEGTGHAKARTTGRSTTHVVHGYHPYWISDDAASRYRYELLTHLAYFSCEIDPATGRATNTRGWLTSAVPAMAQAAGCKVLLTVTNFGDAANSALLGNAVARDTLCATIVDLLQRRDADGVNIDFESIPGNQRDNFTAFLAQLRASLAAWKADAVISVAAPAVDWSGSWDVQAIARHIDFFFIMGYDYSWSASGNAGPVAPLRSFAYNVTRSVDWYLDQGAPASTLLLGVPYYGYDWPVVDSAPGSAATGRASARTYTAMRGLLATNTAQWSEQYLVPWMTYQSSGWRQIWYDDERSLSHKCAFVLDRKLAGMGMWALGYDDGYGELWLEIERAFTLPTANDALPRDIHAAVWPQPARPGATVQWRGSTASEGMARMHDVLGRMVASVELRGGSDGVLRFTAPTLPPGLYVLRVEGMLSRNATTAAAIETIMVRMAE